MTRSGSGWAGRHSAPTQVPQEIRPEFGLDEQIEGRLQSFDEAGDDTGEIERRITMLCHTGQPLLHGFPSGLSHRRDYQAMLRMTAMQLIDERCHRHYFTERDGVDPDHWSVWFVWSIWSIWLVWSTRWTRQTG